MTGSHDTAGRQFSFEFTEIGETGPEGAFDDREILRYIFFSRTGLDPHVYSHAIDGDWYPTSLEGPYEPDPTALVGARVLDAGCGGARLTTVAAEYAAHVVGLDSGEHVDAAIERAKRLPNVDIVQGSVLAPPFRRRSFDRVFSVGVLQHTPDPALGARLLAGLVADRGSLSVWVYGDDHWGGRFPQAQANRLVWWIVSRIAARTPQLAFSICSRLLFPLGRLQALLAARRWTKLLAAPLFLVGVPRHPDRDVMLATIYDYFAPGIVSTHSISEPLDWLDDGGLVNVRALPVPVSAYGESHEPVDTAVATGIN